MVYAIGIIYEDTSRLHFALELVKTLLIEYHRCVKGVKHRRRDGFVTQDHGHICRTATLFWAV